MKRFEDFQDYSDSQFRIWLGHSRANAMKAVLPELPLWNLASWNQKLSATLLEDLSHLEIGLRNLLDAELARLHELSGGGSTWITDQKSEIWRTGSSDLLRRLRTASSQASAKVYPSHEDLLAELSLGFWTSLLGKKNLHLNVNLRGVFFGLGGRNLSELGDNLARINTLRNRLAHQHRILHRDLRRDYELVLRTASLIDPKLARFIAKVSRTEALIAQYSKLQN